MPAEARDGGFPGDGVSGGCEPPYTGTGSRTKSSARAVSTQPMSPVCCFLSSLTHLVALRRVHVVDLSEVGDPEIFGLRGLWF